MEKAGVALGDPRDLFQSHWFYDSILVMDETSCGTCAHQTRTLWLFVLSFTSHELWGSSCMHGSAVCLSSVAWRELEEGVGGWQKLGTSHYQSAKCGSKNTFAGSWYLLAAKLWFWGTAGDTKPMHSRSSRGCLSCLELGICSRMCVYLILAWPVVHSSITTDCSFAD